MQQQVLKHEKSDRQSLVNELELAGAKINGSSVRCPFHEDHNPSGSIYQGDDGAWRFKCHTSSCGFQGDVFDVQAKRLGKSTADVLSMDRIRLPKPAKTMPKSLKQIEKIINDSYGKIEAEFSYTNPATNAIDLVVYRYIDKTTGKKSFKQVQPVEGGFDFGAPPKPWPLYNRSRIQQFEQVVGVEGEKCVHALHDVNIVATTSPCGAGKAKHADWSPLAGKDVILWPDNDDEGIEHMKDVSRILEGLDPTPKIRWIDPTTLGLPPKGDVVDFLKEIAPELRKKAVEDVIADSELMGASKEVRALLEDTISGKRKTIYFPWPKISILTKALLPGTVTLFCGDPGATKSFLLLEALAFWHKKDIKTAVFEMEEDRAFHLYRTLAQQIGSSKILDDSWVRTFPDQTRDLLEEQREFLDSFGRTITEISSQGITYSKLAKWVQEKAKAGCRIIAIDPVTAALAQKDVWIEDQSFMLSVKDSIRKYGSSLILITHPKKGRKGSIGLDDLAGGAAFQRFSQSVIWLEFHKSAKSVNIAGESQKCDINRTLHIVKARNGRGNGLSLGYTFDSETLCFTEHGIIQVKDDASWDDDQDDKPPF